MHKLRFSISGTMLLLVGANVLSALDSTGWTGYVIAMLAGLAAGATTWIAVADFESRSAKHAEIWNQGSERQERRLLEVMTTFEAHAGEVKSTLLANTHALAGIAADHQKQMIQIAAHLNDYTERMTALFEGRLNQEYHTLQSTRQEIAASLEELAKLHEISGKRETAHVAVLEKTSNDVALLLSMNANKLSEKLVKQQKEWMNTTEDMVRDIEGNLDRVLKSQKQQLESLLERFIDHEQGVQEELRLQAVRHVEQMEIVQTLQRDILSVNEQDILLMNKLLMKSER